MTEVRARATPANRRGRLAIAAAVVSATVGLALVSLGSRLTNLSYDSAFWLRADVPAPEVVIIYMDEESHQRLHQPWNAPWDRQWHARLIDRLSQLGARVIAFDVLFEGDRDPTADARLVEAARSHGKVAVAAVAEPALIAGQPIGTLLTRRAFPALAEVTASGVVEQPTDDWFIRRQFFNPNATNTPSLAWQAARLSGASLPSPGTECWLNYYGPPGFLAHRPYFEIFETNNIPGLISAISNRVVFVGAQYSVGFTGGKGTDDFRTPYTAFSDRRSPGVEINATAFLNLIRGDWLRRLSPFYEVALLLTAGLALGAGLVGVRPHAAARLAVILAIVIAVTAIAGGAWAGRTWFPWCVIVMVQLPIALAFSVIGQSWQLLRDKRAFEQALALASEGRGTTAVPPLSGAPVGPGSNSAASTSPSKPANIPAFLRQEAPVSPTERSDLPRVPDHEMVRCVGRGGYGEVWLARDILGSFHAVKLLHLEDFASATPMQTEFDGLKRYTPVSRSHPGLVQVLHVGRDEPKACLYYVMELADDQSRGAEIDPATYVPRTLARDLQQRGRLPLSEAIRLGIHLAEALDHLHGHGLAHRDIKPANIVFVKGQPKLADVGLVAELASASAEGVYLGTPGRIAPEGAGTPAADVFSLGKVLYEAGLGMELDRFPELPPCMIQSGADRNLFEFNRVIMRACEGDVRRRWASAAELAQALRRLGAARPAEAKSKST